MNWKRNVRGRSCSGLNPKNRDVRGTSRRRSQTPTRPAERGVYNLTETGRSALLRWPQMISSPDLQYSVIGVSRSTIASKIN